MPQGGTRPSFLTQEDGEVGKTGQCTGNQREGQTPRSRVGATAWLLSCGADISSLLGLAEDTPGVSQRQVAGV